MSRTWFRETVLILLASFSEPVTFYRVFYMVQRWVFPRVC